jgi:hypothetical protein
LYYLFEVLNVILAFRLQRYDKKTDCAIPRNDDFNYRQALTNSNEKPQRDSQQWLEVIEPLSRWRRWPDGTEMG